MKAIKDPIVVTRHTSLVTVLERRGIIPLGTEHVPNAAISDVAGRNVIGHIPFHLAAHAETLTVVSLVIPRDRKYSYIPPDELDHYVREIVTYQIRVVKPETEKTDKGENDNGGVREQIKTGSSGARGDSGQSVDSAARYPFRRHA